MEIIKDIFSFNENTMIIEATPTDVVKVFRSLDDEDKIIALKLMEICKGEFEEHQRMIEKYSK